MHINLCLATVALLLTHSCVPAMSHRTGPADSPGVVDLSLEVSAGTVEHEGKVLQVFAISDKFAEPSIRLEPSCYLKFNYASQQYEFFLSAQITVNTPKQAADKESAAKILFLKTEADFELVGTGSKQVEVKINLLDSDKAELRFLCPTRERCEQIRDVVQQNPGKLQQNLRIFARVRVRGVQVKLFTLNWEAAPNLIKCDSEIKIQPDFNTWIPFLKRPDNSFSFVRSWNEYVAGFGSPDSKHYWMGLEALHQATNRPGLSCSVRVEMQGVTAGQLSWAEWQGFRVAGSQEDYRLTVGAQLGDSGDLWKDLLKPNRGMRFSTYDRVNDAHGDYWFASHGMYSGEKSGWWVKVYNWLMVTKSPMQVANKYDRWAYPSSASMMFRCS